MPLLTLPTGVPPVRHVPDRVPGHHHADQGAELHAPPARLAARPRGRRRRGFRAPREPHAVQGGHHADVAGRLPRPHVRPPLAEGHQQRAAGRRRDVDSRLRGRKDPGLFPEATGHGLKSWVGACWACYAGVRTFVICIHFILFYFIQFISVGVFFVVRKSEVAEVVWDVTPYLLHALMHVLLNLKSMYRTYNGSLANAIYLDETNVNRIMHCNNSPFLRGSKQYGPALPLLHCKIIRNTSAYPSNQGMPARLDHRAIITRDRVL